MSHALLFVCTANICRSPMAEGVLRAMMTRTNDLRTLEIASAGTHDYHVGRPAFPAAAQVAQARGYDISAHLARRVAPGDFDRYDMILAMDRFNVASLRNIAPTRVKRSIELLLEYGEEFHGEDVPDPYGGELRDFERAMDMIEDGCRGLVRLLAR
jgi:protein-tyrosine phosphatase